MLNDQFMKDIVSYYHENYEMIHKHEELVLEHQPIYLAAKEMGENYIAITTTTLKRCKQ